MTDWAVLGWLDPTLNSVLESKWDEQHTSVRAPRELPKLTTAPHTRVSSLTVSPEVDDSTTHQREFSHGLTWSQQRHHASTTHQCEFSHGLIWSRRQHHASTMHHAHEQRTATAMATTDGVGYKRRWQHPNSVFFGSVFLLLFDTLF